MERAKIIEGLRSIKAGLRESVIFFTNDPALSARERESKIHKQENKIKYIDAAIGELSGN